jgi:hypothetical protein
LKPFDRQLNDSLILLRKNLGVQSSRENAKTIQ